ncbi:hypothetical protein NF867_18235 [Solitalea sp. MAHUQ-68]|uniref:Uncharacterized protein n=1 Tax=Solitalea agri TaxID=2953739 RepID=A0A9X2FDF7_9SPHI|nr:hypothetical protein [Solitalea agri]MCO4294808.1 hypothetical protein [Solitalea agri]
MNPTTKPKISLSILALLISLVSIIWLLEINRQIAIAFENSDGKTRALFGIIEILSFGYKYYLVIPGLFAVILGVLGLKRKESRRLSIASICSGLLIILSVFIRLWTVMVSTLSYFGA